MQALEGMKRHMNLILQAAPGPHGKSQHECNLFRLSLSIARSGRDSDYNRDSGDPVYCSDHDGRK